jgi:lysophospholipase L1-like esterase
VLGPAKYSLARPTSGGPSALARLDPDVLSLSGVAGVIWLEGINDLGGAGATADQIAAGLKTGVARLRAARPELRVLGATVTSTLGADEGRYGHPDVDAQRKRLNEVIRRDGLFDGVLDFDRAVLDPATGRLRPEMAHDTTVGGAGDGIHPNRLGYQAMAMSADLALFKGLPAAVARAR